MSRENLNAEYATLKLARGKAGTCGFLVTPQGKTIFMGFGFKAPVMLFRLKVNDDIFTETTNPFNLIMRKGAKDRPAWAVLADNEWHTLSASNNTDNSISCLAIVDLSAKTPETADNGQFLAVKAQFDSEFAGVVMLKDDFDFFNLVASECTTLLPDIKTKENFENVQD